MVNLAFGEFKNQWAWRVEWTDDSGVPHSKDFGQNDHRPGEAKLQADEFALNPTIEQDEAA
ncbi:MAG: hypothetical protein WCQ50_16215 [Spirochaetota bacterium]